MADHGRHLRDESNGTFRMRFAWLMAAGCLPLVGQATTSWHGHEHLAALVHPITTTIRYADGAEQRNRGSGFVVGNRFYTASHNLAAGPGQIVQATDSSTSSSDSWRAVM